MMKLILLFVVVFSLHIMTPMAMWAAKIPRHEDPKVPFSSDDALKTYHVASLKRGIRKGSTGRWPRKANSSPVCFGARNHEFGRFFVPSSGKLAAIKLVHLYGFVSCDTTSNNWSFWGCAGSYDWSQVNVVITNAANRIVLPPNQLFLDPTKWYRMTYRNAAFARELVLPVFSHPRWVNKGQQFRVWYGEDLVDQSEHDNGGKVCCDVYALYV